jgi:hypothetical protein
MRSDIIRLSTKLITSKKVYKIYNYKISTKLQTLFDESACAVTYLGSERLQKHKYVDAHVQI